VCAEFSFLYMRIDIITIFPHIFDSYFGESIIARAIRKKFIRIQPWDLRSFARGKHKKLDGKPYGGGAGMVLMAEPVLRAVDMARRSTKKKPKVVVLSAKGKQFSQKLAAEWAKKYQHLILVSGRYEGIDERVAKALDAEEISIGPYVMTDGDVGAMAIVSSVARLIPGVIKFASLGEESHWDSLLKKEAVGKEKNLEYPHYTRPETFSYKRKIYHVPSVLLSGDHKKIAEWRKGKRK